MARGEPARLRVAQLSDAWGYGPETEVTIDV